MEILNLNCVTNPVRGLSCELKNAVIKKCRCDQTIQFITVLSHLIKIYFYSLKTNCYYQQMKS